MAIQSYSSANYFIHQSNSGTWKVWAINKWDTPIATFPSQQLDQALGYVESLEAQTISCTKRSRINRRNKLRSSLSNLTGLSGSSIVSRELIKLIIAKDQGLFGPIIERRSTIHLVNEYVNRYDIDQLLDLFTDNSILI